MGDSGGPAQPHGVHAGNGGERSPAMNQQLLLSAFLDALSWIMAITVVMTFFDRSVSESPFPFLMLVAVVGQLTGGIVSGLYRGKYRPLELEEAGAAAVTAAPVGLVLIVLEHFLISGKRGGQILVLATTLAVTLMLLHRFGQHLLIERDHRRSKANRIPIIVYGAGEGGYRAVQATAASKSSPYNVVALIDDDPAKRRLQIRGIRVEGTGADLARVARKHQAKAVLLALPSSGGEQLSELHDRIDGIGLQTLVMPAVQRLVGEGSTREFKLYRDEEILRRKVVDIDTQAISQLVGGSRVLVTGAGGSIGSELVRQLVEFGPDVLIALDHDDSLLHRVHSSVDVEHRSTIRSALADVRDPDRLDEVFCEWSPELVFHAAALKHVPALETSPGEGWKTNVLGSLNVLQACERHEVATVVNISTDKAADPVNVLGMTKRIAECLTSAAAERTGDQFVSVRFGNVIGSRGSAIETFEEQIAADGPVTVTHPDVTRYFMAVREAVRLTMQAAAIGKPCEALVLDMGEPVRVADVAHQLIESSGRRIEIEYIGLRPGEKMHEVLLGAGEKSERPYHPLIDHVAVPSLDLPSALDRCAAIEVSPLTIEGLRLIASSCETATMQDQHEANPTVGRRSS